ncbi:MAG: hypothetical protein RLZZ344_1769 [Pseudomonadota bacterium]|jgi:biopolymer transport protein ExbD
MGIGQFSSQAEQAEAEPISEINMTPFVDVMLVLLIIFIVTAPLMTQGLALALPKADAPPLPASAPVIRIDVAADGTVLIDSLAADGGPEGIQAQLAEKARNDPSAQVQIRADGSTPYARIAEIISRAQAAGLTQIAFVTALTAAARSPPARARPASAPTTPTPTPADAQPDPGRPSRPTP